MCNNISGGIMKKFAKHIIIHSDVIIKAENKKEADKIFEEIQLLRDTRQVSFENPEINVEKEWIDWTD